MEKGSDDDSDIKSLSSGIIGREKVSVFITGVLKGREMVDGRSNGVYYH